MCRAASHTTGCQDLLSSDSVSAGSSGLAALCERRADLLLEGVCCPALAAMSELTDTSLFLYDFWVRGSNYNTQTFPCGDVEYIDVSYLLTLHGLHSLYINI